MKADTLTWKAVYKDGTEDNEIGNYGRLECKYSEIRFEDLKEFHLILMIERLTNNNAESFFISKFKNNDKLVFRKRTIMSSEGNRIKKKIYIVGVRKLVHQRCTSNKLIVNEVITENVVYISYRNGVILSEIVHSDFEDNIELFDYELFDREIVKR